MTAQNIKTKSVPFCVSKIIIGLNGYLILNNLLATVLFSIQLIQSKSQLKLNPLPVHTRSLKNMKTSFNQHFRYSKASIPTR